MKNYKMSSVYELCVVEDDQYFTCGIFSSIQKAIEMISSHDGIDGGILLPDYGYESEIYNGSPEIVELRERPIDKHSHADAEIVARWHRNWHWTKDEEDTEWVTKRVR